MSYSGNLLVENRNGLMVDSRVWEATGGALAVTQTNPGKLLAPHDFSAAC